jgi:hypothetical protein
MEERMDNHDWINDNDTAESQQRFLTEHSSCAMCDTPLDIKHDINRTDLKVKEEAHCPCCGIRVRSCQHLMH